MKSFYEIQSSEGKKKNLHDFNVSQSLPRFLWTMGFVVLCLIFFLCKTGMDSRFQLKLLFHYFQGLFQRSHMDYCDECTLQGVFPQHTSNQRAAREVLPTPKRCRLILLGTVLSECPFRAPCWPQTKAIILNLWRKLEVLEVDKSLRQDCFKMHNSVRIFLTSDCPLECICFLCPKLVISIVRAK